MLKRSEELVSNNVFHNILDAFNQDTNFVHQRNIILLQVLCMGTCAMIFWIHLFTDSAFTRRLLIVGVILATITDNLNLINFEINYWIIVVINNLVNLYYMYAAYVHAQQYDELNFLNCGLLEGLDDLPQFLLAL